MSYTRNPTTTTKYRLQRTHDLNQQHVAIVGLNNRGAEALRLGNTQAAMASLSQALYATNTWLRETQHAVSPSSSSSSPQSSVNFNIDELMQQPEDREMSDDDMDCVSDKPTSPYILSTSSSSPFSSSSRIYTCLSPSAGEPSSLSSATTTFSSADGAYASPIIIPDTLVDTNHHVDGEEDQQSEQGLPPPPGSFVSSIIIFNLALAYHMHALSLGGAGFGGATYLKKAKMLYQLAIKSQEQQCTSCNTVFRMFFMCSVNNLAVVHRALGDEQSATVCFQRLLTVAMFLRYCDHGQSCQLAWFFHNIFRSTGNSMAPAA